MICRLSATEMKSNLDRLKKRLSLSIMSSKGADTHIADAHIADTHIADSHIADTHIADTHIDVLTETIETIEPSQSHVDTIESSQSHVDRSEKSEDLGSATRNSSAGSKSKDRDSRPQSLVRRENTQSKHTTKSLSSPPKAKTRSEIKSLSSAPPPSVPVTSQPSSVSAPTASEHSSGPVTNQSSSVSAPFESTSGATYPTYPASADIAGTSVPAWDRRDSVDVTNDLVDARNNLVDARNAALGTSGNSGAPSDIQQMLSSNPKDSIIGSPAIPTFDLFAAPPEQSVGSPAIPAFDPFAAPPQQSVGSPAIPAFDPFASPPQQSVGSPAIPAFDPFLQQIDPFVAPSSSNLFTNHQTNRPVASTNRSSSKSIVR